MVKDTARLAFFENRTPRFWRDGSFLFKVLAANLLVKGPPPISPLIIVRYGLDLIYGNRGGSRYESNRVQTILFVVVTLARIGDGPVVSG